MLVKRELELTDVKPVCFYYTVCKKPKENDHLE